MTAIGFPLASPSERACAPSSPRREGGWRSGWLRRPAPERSRRSVGRRSTAPGGPTTRSSRSSRPGESVGAARCLTTSATAAQPRRWVGAVTYAIPRRWDYPTRLRSPLRPSSGGERRSRRSRRSISRCSRCCGHGAGAPATESPRTRSLTTVRSSRSPRCVRARSATWEGLRASGRPSSSATANRCSCFFGQGQQRTSLSHASASERLTDNAAGTHRRKEDHRGPRSRSLEKSDSAMHAAVTVATFGALPRPNGAWPGPSNATGRQTHAWAPDGREPASASL